VKVLEEENLLLHDLTLRTAQTDRRRRVRVHQQDLHSGSDAGKHQIDSRHHQIRQIHFRLQNNNKIRLLNVALRYPLEMSVEPTLGEITTVVVYGEMLDCLHQTTFAKSLTIFHKRI
jgi:hypothetical protein